MDEGAPLTTDTLLLSRALRAEKGSTVADLGCGGGGASIQASAHNQGCTWLCIDIRPSPLAELMRSEDLRRNSATVHAICCSVETLPSALRPGVAKWVIANPPYGLHGSDRESAGSGRDLSRRGSEMLIHGFVRAASHLLASGGHLVMINRPSALPEMILGYRAFGLSPVELQPIGERGFPARRILLTGEKGSQGDFSILPQMSVSEFLSS